MTLTSQSRRYRFGRFELQPDERRLLADGAPVVVGPRAFDVLLLMVESGGRLVSKEELLSRVWANAVVVENALQVQVSALRKIVGVDAISTVSGRGYRFTSVVNEAAAEVASLVIPNQKLPQPSTTFVGRDKEIADLRIGLERTRLITLTGIGGCGKTRLALQVAEQSTSHFAEGVWFIELAPIQTAELIAQTIAAQLGCKEQHGVSAVEAISQLLGARRILLVLDNAEHLTSSVAELLDALLRACPAVVFMVTSRERLGLAGELTHAVPSLSVPDVSTPMTAAKLANNESARLFVDRARLQRPHFTLGADNAATLASVCRRLEGIPLAIELAAARVRSMSLEEIDRRLDERLALLTGGSRLGPHRHRTVQAMLDWSYDLLTREEQNVLQRCSVFGGSWNLEAAEQVCVDEASGTGRMLALLTTLVDKCLMLAEEFEGDHRFRLLETVRQYAGQRLAEGHGAADCCRRHLGHYLALAESAARDTGNADPWERVRVLRVDQDNLRKALAWSERFDPGSGLRLAASLWRFWYLSGNLAEGYQSLTSMLELNGTEATAIRADALDGAGQLAITQGHYALAQTLSEQSLEIRRKLGDSSGVAKSLRGIAGALQFQGDYFHARAIYEECLALSRQLGDKGALCSVLANLGIVAQYESDLGAAQSLHEECLALCTELKHRWGVASSLANLANVLRERRRFAEARDCVVESIVIYREVGELHGLAIGLGNCAFIFCELDEHQAARPLAAEALSLARTAGDPRLIVEVIDACGCTLAVEDVSRAVRLWAAAARLRERAGVHPTPTDQVNHARRLATARDRLGDDGAFDAAWTEGASMDLQQAIDHATNATGNISSPQPTSSHSSASST